MDVYLKLIRGTVKIVIMFKIITSLRFIYIFKGDRVILHMEYCIWSVIEFQGLFDILDNRLKLLTSTFFWGG